MATQRKRRRSGAVRKKIGTYALTGNDDNTRLTISTDLDSEPFPTSVGEDVDVELINPDDGHAFLEIHPVGEHERQ